MTHSYGNHTCCSFICHDVAIVRVCKMLCSEAQQKDDWQPLSEFRQQQIRRGTGAHRESQAHTVLIISAPVTKHSFWHHLHIIDTLNKLPQAVMMLYHTNPCISSLMMLEPSKTSNFFCCRCFSRDKLHWLCRLLSSLFVYIFCKSAFETNMFRVTGFFYTSLSVVSGQVSPSACQTKLTPLVCVTMERKSIFTSSCLR